MRRAYERRWRAALKLSRGGRSASWLATWVWWYWVLGDLCQERRGKEFTVETGQGLVC